MPIAPLLDAVFLPSPDDTIIEPPSDTEELPADMISEPPAPLLLAV